VGDDWVDAEPAVFDAVTRERNVAPTSLEPSA
jgi:hypothetical protein